LPRKSNVVATRTTTSGGGAGVTVPVSWSYVMYEYRTPVIVLIHSLPWNELVTLPCDEFKTIDDGTPGATLGWIREILYERIRNTLKAVFLFRGQGIIWKLTRSAKNGEPATGLTATS
jgi:hypothetical protein